MNQEQPLSKRSSDGPLSRWVGFRVGGQSYALDIRRVQEVLVAAEIEPVPGAPAAVLGVINLRGRIVTVVDLGRCLGFAASPAGTPCTVLIADAADGALGLRVDGVAEVCSVAEGAIRPVPPTLGRQPDPLVRGVVGRAEPVLTLLNADLLVQRAAAA
jgi:purine-binding chemotaxis protein CheW